VVDVVLGGALDGVLEGVVDGVLATDDASSD
jgi:hypothetical protein